MTQVIQLNARDDSITNQMVICGSYKHIADPDNFDATGYLAVPRLVARDFGNNSNGTPCIELKCLVSHQPATYRPVDILAKRAAALDVILTLIDGTAQSIDPTLGYPGLGIAIHRAMNSIAQATYRGTGNVVMVNPNHPMYGDIVAGTQHNTYVIVTSPDIPVDDVIVGYVGKVTYDAGVVAVDRDVDNKWNIITHPNASSYYRLIRIGK